MDKSDRYQFQPWYIKLWRRRHYLRIPYSAFRMVILTRCGERPFSFRTAWSVAIGLADVKMNWVYDWNEIKKKES